MYLGTYLAVAQSTEHGWPATRHPPATENCLWQKYRGRCQMERHFAPSTPYSVLCTEYSEFASAFPPRSLVARRMSAELPLKRPSMTIDRRYRAGFLIEAMPSGGAQCRIAATCGACVSILSSKSSSFAQAHMGRHRMPGRWGVADG